MTSIFSDKTGFLRKKIRENDHLSSLVIMSMRSGMLIAKFVLSLFIARYMGLEELGMYGLIVGAAGTVQAFMRGGVFNTLSRDAVHQSPSELTVHLRYYGTGILALYALLIPLCFGIGLYYDRPVFALLILAVFLTEHVSFDIFVLINNLQRQKLANLILSLQSASWIYLYVGLAFFLPSLRTLETLLMFWTGGGLVAIAATVFVFRAWPWKDAFAEKIRLSWYPEKIRASWRLYANEVLINLNLYVDRFLITAFISLEVTGVYVFFFQIVQAINNLVGAGVILVFRPRLIQAFKGNRLKDFRALFQECMVRALGNTVFLSAVSIALMPFVIRLTDKPLAMEFLPLFWLMLFASLFRVAATVAKSGIFAQHQDGMLLKLAIINFVFMCSAGILALLFAGVYGIVSIMIATSLPPLFVMFKNRETRKIIPTE